MFRRDLDEACSIWLTEVEKIADEFQRRTESNFRKPENANGEVADFHALRHTFITMLASLRVHPKVAQQPARHSTITLTMDWYSHTRLVDLNTAVENLPLLARPERLMVDAAPDTLSLVDSVAAQDNLSICVARRVAGFGDVSYENSVMDDETRPAKDVENPLETRGFQGVSSRGSGQSRTDDDGFAIRCLSHLATEPTHS